MFRTDVLSLHRCKELVPCWRAELFFLRIALENSKFQGEVGNGRLYLNALKPIEREERKWGG
jgi:hypothetical protein